MSQFWNEYGLIGLLIAVALGGYFLLGEEREDILASSLDSLGIRLTELVDDDEAKAKTADSFREFKQAVEANEVSPDDVERVAASVLNLSTTGAKLTPEEAEMVFNVAIEGDYSVLPTPSDANSGPLSIQNPPPPPKNFPAPRKTWAVTSSEEIGERVAVMVQFSDKMKELALQEQQAVGSRVQFVVRDGLRVIVDSTMTPVWERPEVRDVARGLERDKAVIWDKELLAERRKAINVYKAQRAKISAAELAGGLLLPEEAEQLKALENLARLHEMGVIFQADSSFIRLRMDRILDHALKQIERESNSDARVDSVHSRAVSG